MSDELDGLRIELDVLERYAGDHIDIREAAKAVKFEIARLEAEQADPWREAKKKLAEYKLFTDDAGQFRPVKDYVDHLTAERDQLAARVAELEDVKSVADMQPPFEGPIVGLEPILDPARVLATAFDIIGGHVKFDAKPYRLKGADE